MGRSDENAGFACAHCGQHIEPLTDGSYRNHCPFCLWSRHVDDRPGDRTCGCRGMMAPIGVRHVKRGRQIVHRCVLCGATRVNRVAVHTVQPDDFETLLNVAEARADEPRLR